MQERGFGSERGIGSNPPTQAGNATAGGFERNKKGGVDLSAFHATQGRRIVDINITPAPGARFIVAKRIPLGFPP
jgi:hypothetical protein